MNKNTTLTIFAVIVIILLGAVVWKYSAKKEIPLTPAQELNSATQADTTTSIDASLDSINTDSTVDTDLNSVDADLKNL
jgi:hypothetical protein